MTSQSEHFEKCKSGSNTHRLLVKNGLNTAEDGVAAHVSVIKVRKEG